MQWFAQAPSNIALIKYMGKSDSEINRPANPSLSYTLNKLLSSVMLETTSGKKDHWEPLEIPGAMPFSLTLRAQTRFLDHLARLKALFEYEGAFILRSSNNFPQGSGLASSASSFAALTKCAALGLTELTGSDMPSVDTLAEWSRLGSGSSCRSFYAPWALWSDLEVKAVDLPYKELIHQVVLISHEEKEVPSTEAHHRIQSSPMYVLRPKHATDHLNQLLSALHAKDWPLAFQVCWREFHDLHKLFSTSVPPFSYITPQSQAVLTDLRKLWEKEGDGPLVTMDAGPNVHLLYRTDQTDIAARFKQDVLVGNYDFI